MVIRPGQRVYIPGVQVSRRAVVSGGDWWTSGGASGCVAAYQPKGAASYAASKVNLANPGTYDAVDGTVYPTWNTATGWTFVGASSKYLTTGITVGTARNWSMLIRYSGVTPTINGVLMGAILISGGNPRFTLGLEGPSYPRMYGNGGYLTTSPQEATATFGFAGTTAYYNGSAESGTISSVAGDITTSLDIGRRRRSDNNHDLYFTGNILAIAIYNNTLSGAAMAAVTTAMVAL